MPIHFMKGGRLALAPLYLGQLYHMLDESVSKIIESVRRYNVVTHADTRFLQIFSWERFRAIVPKLVKFCGVKMIETTLRGVKKRMQSALYMPREWRLVGVNKPTISFWQKWLMRRSISIWPLWHCHIVLVRVLHNKEIITSPREEITASGLAMITIVASTLLSKKYESGEDVAVYNPQRHKL